MSGDEEKRNLENNLNSCWMDPNNQSKSHPCSDILFSLITNYCYSRMSPVQTSFYQWWSSENVGAFSEYGWWYQVVCCMLYVVWLCCYDWTLHQWDCSPLQAWGLECTILHLNCWWLRVIIWMITTFIGQVFVFVFTYLSEWMGMHHFASECWWLGVIIWMTRCYHLFLLLLLMCCQIIKHFNSW